MARIIIKTLPRAPLPFGADEWQIVQSSHIAAVGYKGQHLIVLFNDCSAYTYRRAADHYHTMICAQSIGGYFHKWIKGKIPFHKLEQ